jgi:hypothetical protein
MHDAHSGSRPTHPVSEGDIMPPRIFPTGVTLYDPALAHNQYVIFGAPDGRTHLVDMNGNEVRQWPHLGFPSELIDPALTGGRRGHVLVQLSSLGPGPWGGIFGNRTIGELDWDGRTVWEWGDQAPGGAARQDHDWQRLANGNTLVLGTVPHVVQRIADTEIDDQAIREVAPSGKIVWSWLASDHFEEFGFSEEGVAHLRKTLHQGVGVANRFLTINNMNTLGPNRWFSQGDQRFHPDNIIIDSREGNFVAIIDKPTGNVVWRLGPYFPGAAEQAQGRLLNRDLPRPVDQLVGQHDAHLIPEGLPGAGNLLVFDNQGGAGFPPAALGIFSGSRVLEIDPTTGQILWQYTGEDSDRPVWSFHSSFISSARRLPNGNTLIDEGMNGRIFQVTRDGRIVWEYVNPYFGRVSTPSREVLSNWVYRAQPVPYDWVPEGTPRSEQAVPEIDISRFRVPTAL